MGYDRASNNRQRRTKERATRNGSVDVRSGTTRKPLILIRVHPGKVVADIHEAQWEQTFESVKNEIDDEAIEKGEEWANRKVHFEWKSKDELGRMYKYGKKKQ